MMQVSTSQQVLGDFVWEDVNADGQQDAGEPGIQECNGNLTG